MTSLLWLLSFTFLYANTAPETEGRVFHPEAIEYIKSIYQESSFVGVVEIQKYKLTQCQTTKNCQDTVYTAKVITSYKPYTSDIIEFHQVLDEDFYLLDSEKLLIFLDLENNVYYLDSWSFFYPHIKYLEALSSQER